MEKNSNILRGQPWLMLLALFVWLLPQQAAAELTYEDDPDNYAVELGGSNVIYFTAPCYDTRGADTWIQEGNLRVSVDGADPVTIFTWKSEKNIDNDNTTLKVNFSTNADGFFDITLGNSRNTFRLTKNNGGEQSVVRNSDGKTFGFSAEWMVPYNLLGKKLTFSWDVTRNGNSATVLERAVPGLATKEINMPAASAKLEPFVSLPMLSANNPGKLEIPWFLASDSIVSAYYEYTDDAGKHHEDKIENVKSGTILLDAGVPYRNFRVVCSYKEASDKGSYLIENQGSAVQNIPLIHTPIGLSTRQLDGQDLKVEVKWNVAYPDDEDLTPTDFFEVQRSITGEEKDFVTIQQLPYISVSKQSTYTFVDNTLMDDITPDMLVNGGTLDKLTYRVRRTITKDWNWAKNSCFSSVRSVVDNLHLLRIANYSAKWEDERAYTVRVSWNYADEHGAVWDDRAQMVLRVVMKNRDGQPVDTLVYTLDQNDRAQRYKIVSLSRSCVTYDIDMYVERGESPLNFLEQTEDYFFPIHNAADWNTFRQKVKDAGGQYDVNARLYADISLNSKDNIVGNTGNYPYRGLFDGNGHTITLNISDDAARTALFSHVTNATFRDLHTAGTVTSSQKFISGLIGSIDANAHVTIENCRSSVTLNSSVSGDGTNGGFVAVIEAETSSVAFRNCKFDGSFEGANCSHNGGYVGWANGPVTIENCLFAPASINTKPEGSETWKRGGGTLTLVNSYATRDFTALVVIRTANDWTSFRDMVKNAKGQYDVNAILAADVNAGTIMVGWETENYYRGTFDGNGHTLTFSVNDHGAECLAPFRYVGNATIRNLHTAGTINNNHKFTGGLIGQVLAGSTVNIENCHSSMTLNSGVNGDATNGGFIGVIQATNSKARFTNCKFDGSFEGTNCHSNGGFVGWSDSPVTIVDCLFMPNKVTTNPESSETWARGGNCTTTNSYATKEFIHVINNTSDWEEFRNAVARRGSHSVNAILNADIKAGTSILDFKGMFDGNAHTIEMSCTMFNSANGYTIKNLHVTGAYGGDQHVAGLVGSSWNANIQNCWVSTSIHCNTTHAGGFIGHAHDLPHTINNCLFDGAISAKNDGKVDGTSYVGAFIGWGGGADNYVTNCLEDGNYFYVDHAGFCYKGSGDAWGNTGNSKNNYTYKGVSWNEVNYAGINHSNPQKVVDKLGADNWYVSGENALPKMSRRELWNNVGSLSASDLAKNLGSGWKVDGNKAVPVMGSSSIGATEEELEQYFTFGWTKENNKLVPATTTVEEPVYAEVTKPTLPNFYHKNTGTIDKTLVTTTRQSSVLLAWNTDGNPIDYFTVMRRVKGQGDDAWKEIATFLDDMSYEDTSVSPLATYEYKVLGVNDCEGISTTETEVKPGECKHTGRVDGYVRFNDGTSAAGIQVDINYKGKKVMSVFTDDSGHFVADELSYQGGTSVTYDVSAVGKNGEDFSPKGFSVTFDAHSNDETLREISILNGKRFSGYVMYDGTSIPVKGANFKVNGKMVYNTKGKLLETEYDGSFSFRVLPGNDTIQVVMDGHNFTNDGYFKGATGHNFTDDVAGIYFYDATKVKLTGRVVGGDEQGKKPLGNNLSINNLGDSLTMVLTLEGDNTSWLVYDNLNPNKTQREEVVRHQRNGNKHYTEVKTERKRMVVWPDPTTGEYELTLPPVRWKVQQVYCTGYPTLFQEGQVSEVVDLTNCLTPKDTTYVGSYKDVDTITVKDPKLTYNAIYNRIYRAPVEVTYKQLGYDNFDYFGDKNYYATQLTGETVEVPLAYQKTEGYTAYENPFDQYTHTPTLTPQDAIHTAFFSEEYDKLFDGKPSTKWCSTSGSDGWWVTFKVNQLVSLKTLHLTTGNDTKTYSERNPKAMRLLGRATESDEWKVLMETADAGMGAENLKTYDFDVPNHSFCQFFRLEISSVSNGNILQLGELSLTCRGNADSDPADDHDPDPILAGQATYTFGHPVFSIDRKYTIELQVGENYLYNNDPAGKVDIVRLGGGMAMMQNGMKPGSYDEPVMIDSLGRARFTVQASQTTNMKKSLKTVTFTVMRDGTFLEAKPLQGYVLNMFPVGESTELLTDGQPLLFDILRDPPGSYSSNTLAKGATLNYSYMMNLTLMAGIMITYKDGKKLQTLSATVVAPQGSGTAVGPISAGETQEGSIDQFIYTAQGSKAFSYTMAIGNNISTSGDPSMVGADADLYIGAVQNVVVTPMSTVRAVNKKMFDEIAGRQGGINKASEMTKDIDYGTVVKIADGVDAKGDSIYLIRDVALGYGPKIQSQFIYSQKQILTQIIPNKAKEIVDMMFCGTKDEAQAIADRTGKPVYWSLREPTDSMFAVVNTQIDGHAYNTTIDKAKPGINYMVVIPNGTSPDQFNDEVTEKYQIIKAWTEMIAQNEFEKLQASDLLTNYDIAGAQGVNYSETFDSNFSNSWTHHFPVATEVDYFGPGISYATSAFSIGATIVGSILASMEEMKYWKSPGVATSKVDISKDDGWNASLEFAGKLSQWTITPVALYQTVGANSEAKAFNRTESFTIATDPMSRLSVDVYRVKPLYEYDKSGSLVHNMINPRYIANDSVGVTNIFTNYQFEKMTDLVTDFVGKEAREDGLTGPRGFVFRTRGGATQNPWEDQRTTKFYETGRELDARTLKIVNPKIRLDKQDVSGVSINDAAHFKVYVSNESEKPEATEGLTVLQLFSVDQTNTNGAKISVNGQTLTTGGMTISVVPGSETELDMEVRAGQGFDFMGLTIGVMSPTDAVNTKELVSFNVHYLHEAGGLAIAVPGDKWVLNTNAQMDSKRGWYLPVTINGFDRHQHNFDHIEFQYKESQRGDDSWTNICSFYADPTLMANANGVRKLIPENGNIVTEFFGEGWVMERTYDLRAVLFCRNGNDFLTTSSKIISGIKDTRRPQLFGTPEPKSGLLASGDDIIFNFSEDIEYNYLSAITNFEVKGETNNDNLSEMVSVQFAGQASIETEAKRNFSGKDLTIDMMVKPTETGRDMPLFSHGTNGQKLQLWLTKDFKLKAVVNDQEFTSDSTIVKRGFTQVAMTVNQQDSTVTFFNGGIQCGKPQKLNALYYGTGPLIFGRTNELDRAQSLYYEGKMMEARLWYSAMDGGLIGTTYGSRHLTGYEKDLADYYPMNEGSGDYVIDHTQGANAKLMGANWAIPRGLSLHLEKADKGVELTRDAMNRTSEQDYTLMFWFKTDADGRGTLLSNGRGLKEDNGAENLFHIGFEGDKLMYRSNGFTTEVAGDWSDGQWHNFAMTVNRARNVANIYMDKELKTTFEADSLGGISGGYPLIGATRYDVVKENGDVEVKDGGDALKGNVDELLFFAQALPQKLIETYTTKSPNGDEAGLMTYLSFDRQERQKDNSIELVPYAYSKKLYLDDKGEPRYQLDPMTKEPTDTLVRDYVFVDDMDVVQQHFDAGTAAPVVPNEEVKNLKFGFIGRGNQLLVELDEPAAKLHHRNIYVTVRDIEDKNGNTMASPQTACYYVTNNSLEWLVNRLDTTIMYGSVQEVELPFYNWSASRHTYTIENSPKWLTLDKYTDVLAPLGMDYVKATASKDLNIGTYNEIIYLTDEDGISEPFYLNLTVEGNQPDWAQSVGSELLENSMSISGQVYLYDELDTDGRDIVGAFDNENVCHGFANISHSALTGETGVYLTVYDSLANGRELNFRLWQYSTGREIVLTPEQTITFEKSAVLGTDKPVRFDGGEDFVQYFHLKKGWNWVSFNVSSKQLDKMNTLLTSVPWKDGDIVTDMSSDLTLTYQENEWLASDSVDVAISSKTAYAIKVQEPCTIPVGGTVIKDRDERTIDLKEGWNAIGYTPAINLSVETALSDYFDAAEPGDVIKSHTEFAYFTKTGNTGRWRGSLQYMKPGEGYMMLRKGASDASFTYPYFEMGSTFREDWTTGTRRNAASQSPRTMSVSAVVEGFETEEGDVLVAYSNGEIVGEATVGVGEETAGHNDPLYLSIAGNTQQPIWFAIERDGEIVASTGEMMTFKTNAVIGSPDEPTAISFVCATLNDNGQMINDEWYTIDGLQLRQKPMRKGIYIYNGKKIVIK